MESARQATDDQLIDDTMVRDCREKIRRVMDHKFFDVMMGVIIFSNVLVIAYETNANVMCEDLSEEERLTEDVCTLSTTIYLNFTFIGIYTVEICTRLFVIGVIEFLKNGLNVLDVFVIGVGGFEMVSDLLMATSGDIPNIQILRIFRVLRLVRAVRVLQFFPELYAMVQGFASAMKAMFWGLIMILVLLFIWSILAVEFVHPRNEKVTHQDAWCQDAFSSVQLSMLLFWQTVVAGDAWGSCAVNILRAYPETSLLFGGVLMCVQMGFTNLILSVVVDNAAAAREANVEAKAAEFRKNKKESYIVLEQLINSMDENSDGLITAPELIACFHNNRELRTILDCLDIDEDRLQDLFDLMDKDGSGEIPTSLVVDAIRRATGQDSRMQMLGMQMSIAKIAREVHSLKKTVCGHSAMRTKYNIENGDKMAIVDSDSVSLSDSRSDMTGGDNSSHEVRAQEAKKATSQSSKDMVKAVMSAKLKEKNLSGNGWKDRPSEVEAFVAGRESDKFAL